MKSGKLRSQNNLDEIHVDTINSLEILKRFKEVIDEIFNEPERFHQDFEYYKKHFLEYPKLSVYAHYKGKIIGGILAKVSSKVEIGVNEVAVKKSFHRLGVG